MLRSRYSGGSSDLTIEVYPSGGDNDQVQIQAAIDSLPAYPLGGTISLAAGTFNISGSIKIRGAMTIEGQGVYATRMDLVADVDMFVHDAEPAAPEGFFRLRQLWCDGKKGEGYVSSCLVSNDDLWDTYVNQCFIGNFGSDGIKIQQGWGWVINDTVIEWCKGNGVLLDKGGVNVIGPKISDCKILANMKHAILYRTGGGGNICNNELTATLDNVNDETIYAKLTTGKDISGWSEGDSVQNDTGDGDDWTGKIFDLYVGDRMTNAQVIVSVDTGTYAAIDIADGIENTTQVDTTTLSAKEEYRYAGFALESSSGEVPLTGNRFPTFTNGIGILLNGPRCTVTGNVITGGYIGITVIQTNAPYNIISSNTIYNSSFAAINDLDGKSLYSANRDGASGLQYETWSGLINHQGDGIETTIVLNHKLSDNAPFANQQNISLTPANQAMALTNWSVGGVTSTQFTITFDAALTNGVFYSFYVNAKNDVTHSTSQRITVAP